MNTTAAENVAEDFGWVPGFLENLANNSAFGLVLGGGISVWVSLYLWRKQVKLKQQLSLLEDRRNLYGEFIASIEKATSFHEDHKSWFYEPESRRLWGLGNQIKLECGALVEARINSTLTAVGAYYNNYGQKFVRCSTGEWCERKIIVNFESGLLISAMKEELDELKR